MQQLISPPEGQQLIRSRVCQPQLGFPPWLCPGTWRGLSRRRPGLPACPSEAHSGDHCGPAVPTPPPDPSPRLMGFSSAPVNPLGSQADRAVHPPPLSPPPLPRSLPCLLLSPWTPSSSPGTPCLQGRPFQSPPVTELSWGAGALWAERSGAFTGLASRWRMKVRRKGKKEAETLRLWMNMTSQMVNSALTVECILFNTLISCLLGK